MNISRSEEYHWLERARHARKHAEAAEDARGRAKLLGFATAYEAVARRTQLNGRLRLVQKSA